MKQNKIIILIVVCFVLAAAIVCAVFSAEGYHRLFSWHIFKLDGDCFVYDVNANQFLDNSHLKITERVSNRDGAMIKDGQFIIEGYLDIDKLGETEEDVQFYKGVPVFTEFGGLPGIKYSIYKYKDVGGFVEEEILPLEAVLIYNTNDNTAVINILHDGVLKYKILFGFPDQFQALKALSKF